jgi:hypothetical protein
MLRPPKVVRDCSRLRRALPLWDGFAMAYREASRTDLANPIRSIRIATTLTERFGAILRASELTDGEVGEAQRIYPEIWRHLDEARKALRDLERDTSGFDEMRKQELAQLGITDVEVSNTVDVASLMLGALRTLQVKTVTFNAAGYQRAVVACRELMSMLPEVDWAAVAKAEDREIAAAGWMRAANYRGLVIAVIGTAALIGITIAVYSFFLNREAAQPAPSARQRDEPDPDVKRLKLAAEGKRIDEARALYERTCDVAVGKQLAMLLKEAGQVTAASKIDPDKCIPRRPECVAVRDLIAKRFARENSLVENDKLRVQCFGIMLPRERPQGPFRAAFAVDVEGIGTDRKPRRLRGIVAEGGDTDVIPAFVAGAERLQGVGDLDADGDDELAIVGPDRFAVVRIDDNLELVAVDSMAMKSGCSADVKTDYDFRNGRKGERRLLVLTVPEGQKKHCPPAGRHYYGLSEDKLILVE